MFVAIDKDGNRILADKSLPRNISYYCPICHSEVRLRAGSQNIEHFAHISACTDDFTNDMSEWHKEWQNLFPKSNREVVISHNGETHRADVLCYNTVIEFQHSPISKDEFERRNQFYTSAGYKLIWIFDVIDLYDNNSDSCHISYIDDYENSYGSGARFKWMRPWRFLSDFLPQDKNDVYIFLNITPFADNPKSEEAYGYIERVTWVNPRYKTSWGQFHTSHEVCNFHDLLKWLWKQWNDKKQ